MNRKLKKPKTTKTVYVDPTIWDKALAKGVNISALLDAKLHEIVDAKHCPQCGQKVKGDK